MNDKNSMEHTRHAGWVAAALICAAVQPAAASGRDTAWPERKSVFNAAIGIQQWPALNDLNTEPLGTFPDSGWSLSVSAHQPWKTGTNRDWLWGLDFGLATHESDITAPGDIGNSDVTVFFLTPSLRWSYHKLPYMRINLEGGVGIYLAEIKEFISFGYGIAEGTEHFEETAPGGYIGFSVDVPVGRTRRWSINTGVRVHYADFGTVNAFGGELGSLDGPMTSLQLGLSYDWGGK